MTPGAEDRVETLNDRELLAAHIEGHPDAFGVLFARHRERLWAVALRTTGDREEASDALQEGLISAFRRAGSFRGDAAVTTWLHRIVVNACLDRLRREKVRHALPLEDQVHSHVDRGPFQPGRLQPNASDPADIVLDDEQRVTVLAALDSLPPAQKAALVLVDMEGYSVDEAAAILDCPAGTVKSRCFRGRTRLMPLLRELRGRNPQDPQRVQVTESKVPRTNSGPSMAPDQPAPSGQPMSLDQPVSTEEVTNRDT